MLKDLKNVKTYIFLCVCWMFKETIAVDRRLFSI